MPFQKYLVWFMVFWKMYLHTLNGCKMFSIKWFVAVLFKFVCKDNPIMTIDTDISPIKCFVI